MPHLSSLTSPHHHIMWAHLMFPHLMLMLSIGAMFLSLILNATNSTLMFEWTIMNINSATVSLPIMLDAMGALFISTVAFISFNVLTFSKTYMLGETNLTRFTHILVLFILSMLLLIISPNIITMMLGWDGLGMTSFLLVIYYQNTNSLKSGMITALTNRIGDALLLISIGLIMSQGHWNMMNMWSDVLNSNSISSMMILLAGMTKSAQFPFIAWLPEAMAAPTPVSALVHSSTLVTAGVYILIRLHPFLSQTKMFNSILLTSGLFTSLFAAFWSSSYKDAKKAVALSTLSQLGLMMTSLSLNMVTFCYVHLLTHAMFKATLFMSVGMSIIMKHHRQRKDNLRMMKTMPTVSAAAAISLLSMNAFFFLAGYYSKEAIMETTLYSAPTALVLMSMAAGITGTVLYSTPLWRIYVMSPFNQKQYPFDKHTMPKEWYVNSTNKTLIIPMTFMCIGSISMGSITFWMFIPPSEIPILPNLWHFGPLVCTAVGVYSAISYCRMTTKITNPKTIIKEMMVRGYKLVMREIDMYKTPISHSNPMSWPWYNREQKTYPTLKLVKIPKKKLPVIKVVWAPIECLFSKRWKNKYDTTFYSNYACAHPGTINRKTNTLGGMMTISYNMSHPLLNMSLSTLKAMDQGLTILMSAKGLTSIMPKLSSTSLIHQSNQITKLILMFSLTILMILPLVI